MTINLRRLIKCLVIPLAVGGLASLLARNNFVIENQPPLSPPAWVFAVVWTVLYILMGIASYVVLESDAKPQDKTNALTLYALQLIFNFFWTIIFFNLRQYIFAFVWILALWALIIATILKFRAISKTAAYLLLPYIIWVTFAAYLNLGVAILN